MRKIVATLKLHLRDEDILARYDDVTLALLLPDMDGVTAQILVNKLKMHIEVESKLTSGKWTYRFIQVTAGVVTCSDHEVDTNEFIARAEDALNSSTLYNAVKLYAMSTNGSYTGSYTDGELSATSESKDKELASTDHSTNYYFLSTPPCHLGTYETRCQFRNAKIEKNAPKIETYLPQHGVVAF